MPTSHSDPQLPRSRYEVIAEAVRRRFPNMAHGLTDEDVYRVLTEPATHHWGRVTEAIHEEAARA